MCCTYKLGCDCMHKIVLHVSCFKYSLLLCWHIVNLLLCCHIYLYLKGHGHDVSAYLRESVNSVGVVKCTCILYVEQSLTTKQSNSRYWLCIYRDISGPERCDRGPLTLSCVGIYSTTMQDTELSSIYWCQLNVLKTLYVLHGHVYWLHVMVISCVVSLSC